MLVGRPPRLQTGPRPAGEPSHVARRGSSQRRDMMRRLNLRNLCTVATAVLFAGPLAAAQAFATPPVVAASATPDAGPWLLPFQFNATAVDPDGGAIVRYHWYFA